MSVENSIDTSKSLAELTGIDWGPAPEGVRELVRERHELRRRPIRDLSNENVRRFLDMGCDYGVLVPVALERLKASESVKLLCALLRVKDYDWHRHSDELNAGRDRVYSVDSELSQIEGDMDTLQRGYPYGDYVPSLSEVYRVAWRSDGALKRWLLATICD